MKDAKVSEMPDEVFNECLRAAMEQGAPKLQMSKEEQDSFAQAMKKPEFTKLMKEYMDEISDPKHRQEQEAYLRQLEAENKVPKHMRLVYPKPGFCIKLRRQEEGADGKLVDSGKLFINVCSAEEVDKPKPTSSAKGTSWSLPYSLGPMRHETDKSGAPQPTFDFAMHPEAVSRCSKDSRFKGMVTSTAMDSVEKRVQDVLSAKIKFDRNSARVLRGVACVGGKPAVMQMRREESPGGKENGKTTNSEKPVAASKQTTPTAEAKPKPAADAKPPKPANEPSYRIVHRGKIDLSDFVETSNVLAASRRAKRPKELVLYVQLPKLKSAKALETQLSETAFVLDTEKGCKADYHLCLDLPYPVDEENSTASFDKTKRTLQIVMPVRPPPVSQLEQAAPLLAPKPEPAAAPSLVEEIEAPPDDEPSAGASRAEEREAAVAIAQEAVESIIAVACDSATATPTRKVRFADHVDHVIKEQPRLEEGEGEGEGEDGAAEAVPEVTADMSLEEILAAAKAAAKLPFPKAEDHAPTEIPAGNAGAPELAAPAATRELPDEASELEKEEEAAEEAMQENEVAQDGFVAAPSFNGAKPGFVFTTGPRGLGYYKDAPPLLTRSEPASSTVPPARDEDQQVPVPAPSNTAKPSRLELHSRAVFDLDY